MQRQGFQARIDELKAQVAREHRTEAALEEELRCLRHQALHQPPSASASALLLTKSGCDGDAEPRGAVHACEQCEAGWKAMHTLRCELHEHKEQLQGKTQALSEAVHKIAELEDKASQVEAWGALCRLGAVLGDAWGGYFAKLLQTLIYCMFPLP